MDKIYFNGIQVYAYHGVLPEENKLGQTFIIDLEAELNLQAAGRSDQLKDTVDYAQLHDMVVHLAQKEKYQLIEKVAEDIATAILAAFPAIVQITVKVTKPTPPIPGIYHSVAVEIKRRREG